MLPLRIFPDNTKIGFMKWRVPALVFSISMLVLTIFLFFSKGLNLGIDFTGGIVIEMRTQERVELAKMRSLLSVEEFGEASLQYFGDEREILLRLPAQENGDQAKVVEHVKAKLGAAFSGIEYRKVDYVGPTVGKELVEAGTLAMVLAFAAMLLYIWFRFEWQYGAGGLIALAHDATMVMLFYLVTGYEFSLTSIAAVLTIIGYSINDSVVIYDRIRENIRKYKQRSVADIIDLSVNETLSRTVLTAGTTILSALAIVVFGGEVLRGFSLAMLVGLIVGTYSSIYISSTVLIYFNLRPQSADEKVSVQAASISSRS